MVTERQKNIGAPEDAGRGKISAADILSLIVMLGIYCVASIHRIGIPGAVFDALQADFRTTAGTVSLLGVSFTVVYACDMLLIGPLADKFGGMRMLLTGTLILFCGSLAFVLSRDTVFLIGSRILVGLGAGFIYLSLVKELTRLFPVRYFAVVMGLVYATSSVSNLLSTYPLVFFCEKTSWRTAFGTLTVLLGILAAVFFVLFRNARLPAVGTAKISLRSYAPAFRNAACLKLYYCSACNMAVFLFAQGVIGKKFLQDVTSCGSVRATGVIFVCTIITSLEMMFSGSISFLLKNRRKPFLVSSALLQFFSCSVIIAGIVSGAPFWLYAAGFFMMASGFGFSGIYTATVRDMNPEHTALAVGVLNALGNVFIAAFSFLCGLLLDLFRDRALAGEAGSVRYPPQAYLFLWGTILLLVVPMVYWCFRARETFGKNTVPAAKEKA